MTDPKEIGSRDHFQFIAKAAVATIPFVGGPIASLLADYLPDARSGRLWEYLGELNRRVSSVECKIDDDELGYLVEASGRVAIHDHREFKRGMLAAVVVDRAHLRIATLDVAVLFVRLIEELQDVHIRVLLSVSKAGPKRDCGDLPRISFQELRESIGVKAESAEDYMLVDVLSRLVNYGILTTVANNRAAMVGTNLTGLVRGANYGITPLGSQFLQYLAVHPGPLEK